MRILFLFCTILIFSNCSSSEEGDMGMDDDMMENEIAENIDTNPRFPGCEEMDLSADDKESCAQEKMLEFIYKNLTYPEIARENGVEGMVVIQFIVTNEGTLEDLETVREIGSGCDEEALRVVESMKTLDPWAPATKDGNKVAFLYTLPVRFKLEG